MLGEVFERFVEKSPISVMVRAAHERVLGADRLDLWFERTAHKPYTRDLLFSRVYDLMNQVVFCVQPSVRAAYQAQQDHVGASLVSVYNTRNHLETHTAAELVRSSAREFAPIIAHLGGERTPWLEGYRITMVDGNCLEAREHRIEELRAAKGRALPGQSLVVYEPAQGLVTEVLPCENGHAQERSLFGALLKTVVAGELWIEDRNFCARDFLCTIDTRGAFFITREHLGLRFEIVEALRACGRTETGSVAQQRVTVVDEHGHTHVLRRVRVTLKHATRDGATIIHILTNLPHRVSDKRVAELYRKRWTLETAFQHLEASLHAAIHTLGYPKAALFGFCLALVAYNVLAVILAALRGVHGEETVDAEVSLYYVANEMAVTYHGMMIAIPALEWDVCYAMSPADLAAILLALAQRVRLQAIRKSPRRPKKPHPLGKKPARKGHVATAKLLMNRQSKSATP
jgi:hypothetical protein